jgi:hypothetical protein
MTSAVVRGADCPPFPRWAGTVLTSASAARRTGPQGCDRGPPRRVEPDPDRTITSLPRRPDATLLPLPLAARLRRQGRGRQASGRGGRRRRGRRRRGARRGGAMHLAGRRHGHTSPVSSPVLCPFTLASAPSPPPCSLSTAGGTLGERLSWQRRAVPWISTLDSHHRSPRHPAHHPHRLRPGARPPSTVDRRPPQCPGRPPPANIGRGPPSPKPMLYVFVVSYLVHGRPRQTLLHPSHHACPDVRSAPAGLLATPWTIAGAGIVAPKSTVLALAACMGKMAFCIAFAIRPSLSCCSACLLLLP